MVGSWMNNTLCLAEDMRVYFNAFTNRDLSFAKQLCEEACYKAKDCLAADLYQLKLNRNTWAKQESYSCYLIGKPCNSQRLQNYPKTTVVDRIWNHYAFYYHFNKGKLRL